MRITVLVGNPKAKSRTRAVAESVADAVADAVGAVAEVTERDVVELADYAGRLFDWADADVSALNEHVAGSDFLIVASPTYKATYTGLLKAFLDRYPTDGLAGTVAVPVMTGGSPHHSLAPDTGLRPLLVELAASVPTRSLYAVVSSAGPDSSEDVARWAEANRAALVGAAHARAALTRG
ncbi:NAD(P)H-dependent oxidoreductase [Actinocorallia sp. A-T 12471]|uniref:NAD(P)H-dependent oxidoreductase n=1 Tax=Actinocorallia sp. A-T 12471 TaxID=3089813 RepID=UPI0029CCE0AF|nr:NAD(P)H-dependent oxidoreductase [Actinocorallia sp. A-T 12471]MDX6741897.1 NAD(P)H-dependent oxidoreductase [Actinocorallia sp. A-T 12471]